MSLHHRRQFFGPSCPIGGTFYACNLGTNFVGCCNVEPCSQGCADGSLEPASFNTAFYAKIPDQECPSGSRWYTCTGTTPPFMGCCKTNPCSQGVCPVGDLTAGFLSSNPKIAGPFLSSGSSSSQTTSSSSTGTKSASTSSAAQSPSSTTASPSSSATTASISITAAAQTVIASAGKNTSSGAIAGGVVGGVAVLAIIIVALIVYRWKSKKAQAGGASLSYQPASDFGFQEKNGSSGKNAADFHKAHDPNGNSQGSKDSTPHDLPYPSPTPAYSPDGRIPQSPPGYLTISELDTRSQPQNFHDTSNQPTELSSPLSPSKYRPHRRPEASPTSPSYASHFGETFPSPLPTTSEASIGSGSISGFHLRDHTGADRITELSAADSVRVSRRPTAPMGSGIL